jgi:hypothetical protein
MNIQQLMNPQSTVLKKYLFEILREKFPRNEEIIERVASALVTQGDLQGFSQLIIDVFETGYFKSLNEHKDILTKAGIKVNVVAETKPVTETAPIFKK